MILSFKDVQFIIEALELQIESYQKRLQDEELDEDIVSDIGNDRYFLESLHKDLIRAIKEGNLPKLAGRASKCRVMDKIEKILYPY